jgi:hypothetical protein
MRRAELAGLAGQAVVLAVGTEAWDHMRDQVSRLFGQGQPDSQTELALDETRRRLAEASQANVVWLRMELADQWRARFVQLLADYPQVEVDLYALTADLWESWSTAYRAPPSAAFPEPDAFPAPSRLRPTGRPAPAEPPGQSGPAAPAAPAAAPAPAQQPPAPAQQPPAPAQQPAPPAQQPAPPPPYGLPAQSAPRPQTAPGPSYDDMVTSAIKAAVKPGVLAFNPPPEMTQGRAERVDVGIARSPELRDALLAGLRGQGEVQFEDMPTSTLMAVELRGTSFEIAAFSPLAQVVAPTARWEFDVRPLRSGVQTLTLCVSMRIEQLTPPLGTVGRIGVPVLERQIRIRVSVGYGTRSFLAANWQWLVATAVAAGAAIAAWVTIFH